MKPSKRNEIDYFIFYLGAENIGAGGYASSSLIFTNSLLAKRNISCGVRDKWLK